MTSFSAAFERFVSSGDFLALTREFELGIPAPQEFRLENATVKLLATGVLQIEPDKLCSAPKDILISSGIHGNETAPIEIVNQLVTEIIIGKTAVINRSLFIIGNPVAMNISQRFQVENLNRLFCGKYKNIDTCYEKQRAQDLESYVSAFFTATQTCQSTKYHYDLHTAIRGSKYEKFAIYPYQADKPWNKGQLAFLHSSGINTILFGHAPSGTFSYYSNANFGAHAFTIELGQVKPFGENNMANFTAIEHNLRCLIEDKAIETTPFDNRDFNLFSVLGDITKNSDAFKLYIAEDVRNFTDFPVNTLLSEDGAEQYRTSQPGESIVFPNAKVANGQRAGLMVIPTQL